MAASAVRFYDNYGLIPSTRTVGNQRRFHQVDACLIKVVQVAQRVGLSIAQIRNLLADLPAQRDLDIEHFEHLRRRLENEVHDRVQTLSKTFDDLTSDQKLYQLPPGRAPDCTGPSSTPHKRNPSAYQYGWFWPTVSGADLESAWL